jgi:hypothetical protein
MGAMASICSAVASTLGWRCISFILAVMGIVEVGIGLGGEGMEWSGVEWNGVEWSGVEWSGVEWERDESSE